MPLDIPIIGACECLAYLHTVLDILLLPLTSTILFTTAIERYYCIVYAERYAYSGASCTFNIHVIAVLLAIPAAAYELYGLLLSSAMVSPHEESQMAFPQSLNTSGPKKIFRIAVEFCPKTE